MGRGGERGVLKVKNRNQGRSQGKNGELAPEPKKVYDNRFDVRKKAVARGKQLILAMLAATTPGKAAASIGISEGRGWVTAWGGLRSKRPEFRSGGISKGRRAAAMSQAGWDACSRGSFAAAASTSVEIHDRSTNPAPPGRRAKRPKPDKLGPCQRGIRFVEAIHTARSSNSNTSGMRRN